MFATSGQLDEEERIARLRLIRTPRVGPVAYRQLMARAGSAVVAVAQLPELAKRGGAKSMPIIPAIAVIQRELDSIDALGAKLLLLGEAAYPKYLARCDDAPPALIALGHEQLLNRKAVAIVGARNASTNGRKLAAQIAAGLAEANIVVVSGMARGIDSAAHQAALTGGTIAVVAGGIDIVYPRENQPLYERLIREGLVVSEMPPGTQPTARHFPRRNRIISGLALGSVVVEAAQRSGSLITARLAGEQGREVMAVPGSPLDPRAQGTNQLIRDGAVLVQCAADVIEVLAHQLREDLGDPGADDFIGRLPIATMEPDEGARQSLLEALGPAPVGVDDLIRETGLAAPMVAAILLELELAGRVERQAGSKVALIA